MFERILCPTRSVSIARLAGGWLDAGPDDDVPGGYLVTAYLPAAGRATVTA